MSDDVLISPGAVATSGDRFTLLDASWLYPPFNGAGIDVRQRYAEAHPPGAFFLDLAALAPSPAADVAAITPPPPGALRAALGAAGIAPHTPLVMTDMEGGTATAPFARLALLDAGCTDVRLLDGGTPAWCEAGLPLTDADPRFVDKPGAEDERRAGHFIELDEVRRRLADGALLVDARLTTDDAAILGPAYADTAVPFAVRLPAGAVLRETCAGQRLASPTAIAAAAVAAGLTPGRPTIVACHFGVAAAAVATALQLAGWANVAVDRASVLGRAHAAFEPKKHNSR